MCCRCRRDTDFRWRSTRFCASALSEPDCVFNDSAIAALSMQAEGCARRVAILDCDVHQGNGTASILADEPTMFTFSIHAAKNFPFRKEASDMDIEMPDGTGDAGYLD